MASVRLIIDYARHHFSQTLAAPQPRTPPARPSRALADSSARPCATAKYAFAGSGAHQIPLDKGQRVTVEKKCQGWLRGTAMNADGTPGAKGMFPESYIQIEANPPPPRSPKPAPPRPKPGPPAASPQSSASAISPVKRTSAAASPRESKSKKKKSPSKEKSGKSSWAPVQRTGIVEYKFVANGKYQISLQKGAKVFVKTQAGGWYKGNLLDDPTVKGIFPQSYVKLLDDEPQPPAPAQGAAIASTSSLNAMEPKPKPPPGSPSQDTMTASTSSLNVPEPRVSRQRTASVDPGGVRADLLFSFATTQPFPARQPPPSSIFSRLIFRLESGSGVSLLRPILVIPRMSTIKRPFSPTKSTAGRAPSPRPPPNTNIRHLLAVSRPIKACNISVCLARAVDTRQQSHPACVSLGEGGAFSF